MGRLILIRHGETSKNYNGKIHDSFDPEELNNNGIVQIQKTANRIKEYKPIIVYCSKERRAVQSANIISTKLDVQLKEIDGLHERNWGKFSGRPWSEIQAILDPLSLEERYTYVPPEGESWQSFETRLNITIDSILDKHQNETVAVVTHGGVIRVLMPHLLQVSKEESFKYNPTNASITVFERDNGHLKSVMIDNTEHLIEM